MPVQPRVQAHWSSKPEDCGCGLGDGGAEGFGAPVVTGCDAAPVLQSTEHDLDPVAALITSFVVAGCFAARLPTWDAGASLLVFQRIPEPVGIIAPVGEHPLGIGQTAQQRCGSSVVADLACGHEELQ